MVCTYVPKYLYANQGKINIELLPIGQMSLLNRRQEDHLLSKMVKVFALTIK